MIPLVAVQGSINVTPEQRRANIRAALKRGLPQVRGHHGINPARLCLVGGGPSLTPTLSDLRAQAQDGAKLVGLNGTYTWLLEHDLRPSSYVQVDARPTNRRFLEARGHVRGCTYFLASHLDPVFFDLVAGWPDVYLFHAISGDDPEEFEILNEFYFGRWQPIDGGSTVLLRSLRLFSLLGFREFDMYGCDSCYLDGAHHSYQQPENDADVPQKVIVADRTFSAAPWQISQALEFMDFVRARGDDFALRIHGDGLLAHVLRAGAAAYDALTAQRTTT